MIATVVTSSFATRWLGTWLPLGWTTRWYSSAWNEFQLWDVLIVTFQDNAQASVWMTKAAALTYIQNSIPSANGGTDYDDAIDAIKGFFKSKR